MRSIACASITEGFLAWGSCKGPRAGRGSSFFHVFATPRPVQTEQLLDRVVWERPMHTPGDACVEGCAHLQAASSGAFLVAMKALQGLFKL